MALSPTGRRWVLSRWTTIDPMAAKYGSLSPYSYCAGNPIRFFDSDGMKVKGVFDRTTNKLYILDLDYYKKDLPFIYVSPSDYQLEGIRDKNGNLTHNQVLVINNVFSGGKIENGRIVRDKDDERQKVIPNARYDIVDNDSDTDHCGWFRLDGQDNKRYNDKDDDTSRDGYRLHLGGLSFGCITIDKTQDNAQKSWDVVTSILKSTTTTNVPEKRGRQWLNPFSRLTHYGTLIVIGDEKPHLKQGRMNKMRKVIIYLTFAFVFLTLTSCGNRDIQGIEVSEILLIASKSQNIDYRKLLNKAIKGEDTSIKQLALLEISGGASAYDHGAVLVDLIEKIGEEMFINSVGSLTDSQTVLIRGSIEAGLEYGDNPSFHNKKIDDAFPQLCEFLNSQ